MDKFIPEPQEGDLKWWHAFFVDGGGPQITHNHSVESVEMAKIALREQIEADLALGERIAWSAFGLEIFHDGDWEEWYGDVDEYEEADIMEMLRLEDEAEEEAEEEADEE